MHQHTSSCTSPLGMLLYFVAGGVAGASAALLLAPQSGRATREMVRRRIRDTADSTRELGDQVIERGRRIRHEASQRLDGAVSALVGHDDPELEK